MRDIKTVELEIQKFVDKYARVQKRMHGDCAETKRIEGEIDKLEIELKALKSK